MLEAHSHNEGELLETVFILETHASGKNHFNSPGTKRRDCHQYDIVVLLSQIIEMRAKMQALCKTKLRGLYKLLHLWHP